MDILISSNLERLIYRLTEMTQNKCTVYEGAWRRRRVHDHRRDEGAAWRLYGNYCSEGQTKEAISATWYGSGYVIDTHTAVAAGVYQKYLRDTQDTTPTVIASTASPYKFTRSVMDALSTDMREWMTLRLWMPCLPVRRRGAEGGRGNPHGCSASRPGG